jgi:hypothetical protein
MTAISITTKATITLMRHEDLFEAHPVITRGSRARSAAIIALDRLQPDVVHGQGGVDDSSLTPRRAG